MPQTLQYTRISFLPDTCVNRGVADIGYFLTLKPSGDLLRTPAVYEAVSYLFPQLSFEPTPFAARIVFAAQIPL
jgi:hypothetical protein